MNASYRSGTIKWVDIISLPSCNEIISHAKTHPGVRAGTGEKIYVV